MRIEKTLGRLSSEGFFIINQKDIFGMWSKIMLDKSRLRIAIQKSGRLSEESRELLARCGIKINLQQQRLIAYAENMPIDLLRVRFRQ